MNRIVLIGNLTADAEFKQVGDRGMVKFRMATNERWGKDPAQQHTEYTSVVRWGGTERLAQALHRGRQVAVEGSLRTRKYNRDGQDKWITEVHATSVELLGAPRGDAEKPSTAPDTDEIPF